jgi:ankyrin repeat protein
MTLPNELFLEVALNLRSFEDLNSLARTSRFFRTMFHTYLYHRAIAADGIVLDGILSWVLSRYRLDSLMLFLDNGLPVNHTGRFFDDRREGLLRHSPYEDTMLRFTCALDDQERSVPLARYLIERGADMEAKEDQRANTVLYSAIRYRNCPIAALLLEHGADPNALNEHGKTPLLCASGKEEDHAEMIQLLLAHGADIEARSADGDTPLLLSSQNNPRIMAALLEYGAAAGVHNDEGDTPLHCAAMWFTSEHHELAKSLLEHGADVNATDGHGETPLHWLLKSAEGDELFMVVFLLENGADVNAISNWNPGLSPLQCVFWGSCEVDTVVLLIEFGADVSRLNNEERLLLIEKLQ